jgi:hypothetical protein
MRILIAAVVVLAGCSTQPPSRPVTSASNVELCEAVMYGPGDQASIPQGEIARRGVNCQDYMPAIMQAQQNRAQAAQILMQQQPNQYRPLAIPPPIRPQQTTCTTQRVGGTLQTVCR